MKLIALHNFRNTFAIDLDGNGKLTEDEKFVKQGTVFHIGGPKPFEQCSKADQEKIALLAAAKCVGDAENKKVVETVRAEMKSAEALEKRNASTAVAAGSAADLVKQLTEALVALTGKTAKT